MQKLESDTAGQVNEARYELYEEKQSDAQVPKPGRFASTKKKVAVSTRTTLREGSRF
jgi:hypothetical protein